MTIEWQRTMKPGNVLRVPDARGIVPYLRIWVLERGDLSEGERARLAKIAIDGWHTLSVGDKGLWNAFGAGYTPPISGFLSYMKEWIRVGPFPVIPDPNPDLGERYFFRNNYGKVFLVKHKLHAPEGVGAVRLLLGDVRRKRFRGSSLEYHGHEVKPELNSDSPPVTCGAFEGGFDSVSLVIVPILAPSYSGRSPFRRPWFLLER